MPTHFALVKNKVWLLNPENQSFQGCVTIERVHGKKP